MTNVNKYMYRIYRENTESETTIIYIYLYNIEGRREESGLEEKNWIRK